VFLHCYHNIQTRSPHNQISIIITFRLLQIKRNARIAKNCTAEHSHSFMRLPESNSYTQERLCDTLSISRIFVYLPLNDNNLSNAKDLRILRIYFLLFLK